MFQKNLPKLLTGKDKVTKSLWRGRNNHHYKTKKKHDATGQFTCWGSRISTLENERFPTGKRNNCGLGNFVQIPIVAASILKYNKSGTLVPKLRQKQDYNETQKSELGSEQQNNKPITPSRMTSTVEAETSENFKETDCSICSPENIICSGPCCLVVCNLFDNYLSPKSSRTWFSIENLNTILAWKNPGLYHHETDFELSFTMFRCVLHCLRPPRYATSKCTPPSLHRNS